MGTQVLLDACRKYGNIRFHQVSTDEARDLPLDRPDLFFTEESPIHTLQLLTPPPRRRLTC